MLSKFQKRNADDTKFYKKNAFKYIIMIILTILQNTTAFFFHYFPSQQNLNYFTCFIFLL